MTCTVTDFAKNRTLFTIGDCRKEELENKLNLFFSSTGYKIKSENPEEGKKIYKKGNLLLRYIFGAFVKYHQVLVIARPYGSSYTVLVQRDASGISGGLIGMKQVREEFERLTEDFKSYFSS